MKHLKALLVVLILVYCAGFWADKIYIIAQDPQGFGECFLLVTRLIFKELIWH